MPLQRVLLGENKHIGGWGLFAGEPILKGEFIGEYAGEVSAV
jgi:SET domain-containing protein